MTSYFDDNLRLFGSKEGIAALQKGLHGLEKESLRATLKGSLALTEHPKSLSNPLTDEQITTDFSESQLELITRPHPTPKETLEDLWNLHKKTWAILKQKEELIWPQSMPCKLPKDADIPIAHYGDSPEAQEKEVYRRGLATRYGKTMQTLSGVHYNFSVSEEFWDLLKSQWAPDEDRQSFINRSYLGLLRNFVRHRWFLIYLFGASPLAHESYKCPLVAEHKAGNAIALRMSRCGYANSAKIQVDYNDFDKHLSDIRKATETPYPPYEALGLEKDGQRIQLNSNLLQIANEYYFPLRLKPKTRVNGLLEALEEQGAAYVEVRIFDLNPFEPTGVSLEQLEFTQLFLLFNLLSDSPFIDEKELNKSTDLQQEIALKGRGCQVEIKKMGDKILDGMEPLARLMGREDLLQKAQAKLDDPRLLLSAQILEEMCENEEDFIGFGIRKAKQHAQKF